MHCGSDNSLFIPSDNVQMQQAQDDEAYFKVNILRIFEQVGSISRKVNDDTLKQKIIKMLEKTLPEFIGLIVKDLDEHSVSGSFVTDVRKVIREWRRTLPHMTLLFDTEANLAAMEQRIMESRMMRIETLKRIEEDRERHKRSRERTWRKIYTNQLPESMHQHGHFFVLPNTVNEMMDQTPDFDDAWDRISDLNDDDYQWMEDESKIMRACYVLPLQKH